MRLGALFRIEKPVIAMAHLPALSGSPRCNRDQNIKHVIDYGQSEVEKLVAGGVDANMICNEDDRPCVLKAGLEQVRAMTCANTAAAPKDFPFGLDFLRGPIAALAIAMATGAMFIREAVSGLYESDMGLWTTSAGELLRNRAQICADNIRLFYDILPEFASMPGARHVAQRAREPGKATD